LLPSLSQELVLKSHGGSLRSYRFVQRFRFLASRCLDIRNLSLQIDDHR